MKKENSRTINILYISSIVLIILVLAITGSYIYYDKYQFILMPTNFILSAGVDLCGMLVSSVLIISLSGDKPWNVQNRAIFRLIFLMILLFHFEVMGYMTEQFSATIFWAWFYNTALMLTEPFLVYSFWRYVCAEFQLGGKRISILNAICAATAVLNIIPVLLNLKYKFFFVIDYAGFFSYGEHYGMDEIPVFIIYLVICFVVLSDRKHSVKEKMTILSFQIFQVIAHLIGAFGYTESVLFSPNAWALPAYLLSIMFIYINVFAARSRRIAEQQVELDKQGTALMISQIQPHFLYNVLTTISNLCVTDPEEAEETTVLFSQYLRTNLDSLRKSDPVPFGVELGHIRTYIELEKKRFGDKIIEEINCPEKNFKVPALGLQPIVENSIKHGIRGKDSPGHLKITSSRVKGGYEVVIEDDGVGFDMNAPLPEDGRSHVGMKNVKSRLERMCGAKVVVSSSPGNGCRTEVFFPEDTGGSESS